MTRRLHFPARLAASAAIAIALSAGVLAAGPQAASSATANPVCGPMQHVLDASGQPVPPVNAMQPVLLVHGFNETPTVWDHSKGLAAQLDAPGSGFFTGRFDYSYAPGLNQDWVTDPRIAGALAQVIDCMAQESRSAGGDGKVIVIGHSMGGLALQQALAEQVSGRNVASEVGGLVSIGTPWQGADPDFDTLVKVIQDACDAGLQVANPAVTVAADACLAGLLKLGIASQAGPAMLPAPGGGPSAAIQQLPKIPPDIPVLAVAGDMIWADQRLNQKQDYQGSDGVVSVASATSPSLGSGTDAKPLTRIDRCLLTNLAAVPVHSKGPVQPFSSRYPLCFHITLPADPRAADQIVPVLQQWRGTLLAPAPCTAAAMVSAIKAAHVQEIPSNWSLKDYACEGGYAYAGIEQAEGGLAFAVILKQQDGTWKIIYGPGLGVCLALPSTGPCQGFRQPPIPLPILQSLIDKITSSPASTCSPGALTKGLAAANPQLNSIGWKLKSYACANGWAVVQIYAPTAGNGTAFLRQTASGWSSDALGEVNCADIPGPLAAPLPSPALTVSLLGKAGICASGNASPSPSPGYFRYTNLRFKFSFDVPDGYTAGTPPQDGDGQSFTNSTGTATITGFGQDSPPGETNPAHDLAELVSARESSGDQITLRYLNGSIVAVSGTTPQGAIFYQRDVVLSSVIYSPSGITRLQAKPSTIRSSATQSAVSRPVQIDRANSRRIRPLRHG